MFLNQEEKNTFISLMRWGFYFIFLMLNTISLWLFGAVFESTTFEEHGFIENLQLAVLVSTMIVFLILSTQKTIYRPLSLFFLSLVMAAFCRELDAWFDNFWILGWEFALIFPVIGGYYVIRHLSDFKKSLLTFCHSSSFFLMYASLIVIMPVAQCIGHKSFFRDVLGEQADARMVRRLLEESIEYCGYVLLLMATFEFYYIFFRKRPLSKQKNKNKRK